MKHSLLFILFLGIVLPLQAQIPRVLSYQGVFSDTLGTLKPDGKYSFTFSLYEVSSGGQAVWSETKEVEVRGGVFSTRLGDVTPLTAVAFNRPYWLGIAPSPDPEIVPRVALSSVGYSIAAARADTAAYALNSPVPPSSDSARIAGALSLPFQGIISAGGSALSIINTKSSGIYAEADSGIALDAYSYNGTAVYASTEKIGGIALFARAYALSGLSYAVFGSSESNRGIGGYFEAFGGGTDTTYGIYGRSFAAQGYGVYGEGTSTTGNNIGVFGRSKSTSGGYGVLGQASGVSGSNYGVMGTAVSPSGYGGYFSSNFVGLYSTTTSTSGGYAVRGHASGLTGVNYGVYGSTNSTSGYAGYFSGNVHVSGTLSKAAGSFKIDHPLDPANKYLSHSFVESPDMMNIYNGNVQLDAGGEAWVELPEWFDSLNKEFRYQLTCIGGFAPVYVAAEIEENRFRIAGGTPGLKISWQVTGIRKDAYAEQHRIKVEEEKGPGEKGFYLNPEAFGLTRGMGNPEKPLASPEGGNR